MNPQTIDLDIRQFLNQHLVEVFSTMLTMSAVSVEGSDIPRYEGHVTGSVGFAGEMVTGAVYLHLSTGFAVRIASAMTGLEPEDLTNERDVNDVIGEVTNMLAGGLKSSLCDAGAACAVSTPAIIRGTAFEIECGPDVRREVLLFEAEGERIGVEVHIKFN